MPGLVGNHPHLNEMHGLAVCFIAGQGPGVVLLGVQDAAAGRHPLCQARIDDTGVAGRVLVHERTAKHPRHDLHIAVRVRVETLPGVTVSSLLTSNRPWWVLAGS